MREARGVVGRGRRNWRRWPLAMYLGQLAWRELQSIRMQIGEGLDPNNRNLCHGGEVVASGFADCGERAVAAATNSAFIYPEFVGHLVPNVRAVAAAAF